MECPLEEACLDDGGQAGEDDEYGEEQEESP
jgi:hypothetical protein